MWRRRITTVARMHRYAITQQCVAVPTIPFPSFSLISQFPNVSSSAFAPVFPSVCSSCAHRSYTTARTLSARHTYRSNQRASSNVSATPVDSPTSPSLSSATKSASSSSSANSPSSSSSAAHSDSLARSQITRSDSRKRREDYLSSLLSAASKRGVPVTIPSSLPKSVSRISPAEMMRRTAQKYGYTQINAEKRKNTSEIKPTTNHVQPSDVESGNDPALRSPPTSSTSRSFSGRMTASAADEMSAAMAEQLSIVQPTNPHSSNIVTLGTPNAGKSSLVNFLVGSKISAVSHKKNTTRTSVLGVATRDNKQIVIFDTPGVLPKLMSNKYQKELSTAAWDAAQGAEVALVIIDVVKRIGDAEMELLQKANQLIEQNPDIKLILVCNKMDLCKPVSKAREIARHLESLAPFHQVHYVSLLKGLSDKSMNALVQSLYDSCVPRAWEHAPSRSTDQSDVELVNEIVREKIFERVHQEIPYRVSIVNEGWTPIPATADKPESIRIDLNLQVENKQQKLILTGHNDSMLFYLRQRSLPEIEALLKRKVHLFMRVTVPHRLTLLNNQ